MILGCADLDQGSQGIPRESGDDPFTIYNDPKHAYVFPARAGMIRINGRRDILENSIPRESGDDPIYLFGI